MDLNIHICIKVLQQLDLSDSLLSLCRFVLVVLVDSETSNWEVTLASSSTRYPA